VAPTGTGTLASVEHLSWSDRPLLKQPVVVAAFEGWNDAGDAASTAARWLRDRLAPEPLATIDAEDFFDFTATRPQVTLADGVTRAIEWPTTDITWGSLAGIDAIVVVGHEPHLRWRTFCEQVVAVARSYDARLVLTLGALLAEVPHTAPVSIMGTAVDDALITRHGLRRSSYEGPTGIVGVLQDACGKAGIPSGSLWASVPAYVPGAPSPKAALALVERAAEMLSVGVVTTDLEIASAAYERQVSEVVAEDDEMREYVAHLEARYNGEVDDEEVSQASLVEEVERFLRDQRFE
jgi:proteasome assembly chaperone (PAC2) family protein